jgi:hypothetical protein
MFLFHVCFAHILHQILTIPFAAYSQCLTPKLKLTTINGNRGSLLYCLFCLELLIILIGVVRNEKS